MKIFAMNFRRALSSAIIWGIVLGVLYSLAMVCYPTLSSTGVLTAISNRLANLPLLVQEILALQTITDLSQLLQFFAYCFQLILLLSGIYAALLGARALSPEEGHGTIEYLCGQPVSRSAIAGQKLACAAVGYLIYVLLISGIAYAATYLVDRTQGYLHLLMVLLPVFGGLLLMGLIFLVIGFFFSALLRSGGESIPIALAIVIVSYILGLMGTIISQVGVFKYFSPIHAVDPLTMIQSGIGIIPLGAGIVIIAVLTVCSFLVYRRKDFLF